jgi:hypothetical protein
MTGSDKREILRAVIDTVTVAPALRGRNKFDSERVNVRWRA